MRFGREEYGSNLRTFDEEHEVASGVVARRTGGHTPEHSVGGVASGGVLRLQMLEAESSRDPVSSSIGRTATIITPCSEPGPLRH